MAQYVVLGTAPTHEGTVVVGPFRSIEKARVAGDALTERGYNATFETCLMLSEVGEVDWSEWG